MFARLDDKNKYILLKLIDLSHLFFGQEILFCHLLQSQNEFRTLSYIVCLFFFVLIIFLRKTINWLIIVIIYICFGWNKFRTVDILCGCTTHTNWHTTRHLGRNINKSHKQSRPTFCRDDFLKDTFVLVVQCVVPYIHSLGIWYECFCKYWSIYRWYYTYYYLL